MKKLFTVLAIFALIFAACEEEETDNGNDGITWENEPDGTLEVINSTTKDFVLFHGMNPSNSSILGGIKGSTTRKFDISTYIDDFNTGGFIVIRGMTIEEYNKNKENLFNAKAQYSDMAVYGQGKNSMVEINELSFGDYCFRVTNTVNFGIELRKDSPEGVKIGFVPSMTANYMLYTGSSDSITVYPVYVSFNKSTGTVTTIKPTSPAESVTVSPLSMTNPEIRTYVFPSDPDGFNQSTGDIVSP